MGGLSVVPGCWAVFVNWCRDGSAGSEEPRAFVREQEQYVLVGGDQQLCGAGAGRMR